MVEAPLGPSPARPAIRVVEDPAGQAKPEGWTRFVCFSDTHGREAQIPAEHCHRADVLLHAGDFTMQGCTHEVRGFAEWLRNYPAAHKIVIAGNHDVTFEPEYYERVWAHKYHQSPSNCGETRRAVIDCCTYLEAQDVEVLGYRIYGAPYQPAFANWAFNRKRGAELQAIWDKVPDGTDILLTHGPPYGIGDRLSNGEDVGCKDLLSAVRRKAIPLHVAGHIHEGYGTQHDGTTLFVNASTCTHEYKPENPPIVLDVPPAAELRGAPGPTLRSARRRVGPYGAASHADDPAEKE